MTPYVGNLANISRIPQRMRPDDPTTNRLFSKDENGNTVDNSLDWIRETIRERLIGVSLDAMSKNLKPKQPETYNGGDNLDEFDGWLTNTIRWMALSNLGGFGFSKDQVRLMVLGQCLSGEAMVWFNTEVESPHRARKDWSFKEAVCSLFDYFVHKTSSKVAALKYRSIKFSRSKGVSGLFNEMRKHAKRMVQIPNEYDQNLVFMGAIPEDIERIMTEARGLSAETSSLEELYINALQVEELLQKNKIRAEQRAQQNQMRTNNGVRSSGLSGYPPRDSDVNRRDYNRPNRPMVFKRLRGFTPRNTPDENGRRRDGPNREGSSTQATRGSAPETKPKRVEDRSRDNDKSRVQCYKCKGYGHFANDAKCPLFVKAAIRRLDEVRGNGGQGGDEHAKEDVREESLGTGATDEDEIEEETYEGSQYDSEESLYYAEEEYQAYTSDSEEHIEHFRPMRISWLRGETDMDGNPRAGPSGTPQQQEVRYASAGTQTTEQGPTIAPVATGLEDIAADIMARAEGNSAAFWMDAYDETMQRLEYARAELEHTQDELEEARAELTSQGLRMRMALDEHRDQRTRIVVLEAELDDAVTQLHILQYQLWGEAPSQGSTEDNGSQQSENDSENEEFITPEGSIADEESIEDNNSVPELRAMSANRDREYRTAINPRDKTRPQREYRCMTAYVEVNGVQALALFDSGSSVDAVSNEFARVANLKTFQLEKPIALQLGTVGSRSMINFGTRTDMSIGTVRMDTYLDVVNVDHYDVVIGVPTLTDRGISLDFDTGVIRMRGSHSIPSLKAGEESQRKTKQKNKITQQE